MTHSITFPIQPSPKEMATLRAKHELDRALAQELLASLGYGNETVPLTLWREFTERACRYQFLDSPDGYNKTGGQPPQRVLLHRLRFPNLVLAEQFIAHLAKRHCHFKLGVVIQPVECLEDREVELRHRVLMTAADVTRIACQLLEVAHTYACANYSWHPVKGNQRDSAPTPLSFHNWPGRPKRTMRLRTEFYSDAILARILLAPFVCRWTDVEGQSLATNGMKPAVATLDGHEAEFELADDSVTLDQLRWLLSKVTDMHIAAESLNYADGYTGDRLDYEYLDRMTPPGDVLLKLRKTLARLASFKRYLDARFTDLIEGLNVDEVADEVDDDA